MSVITHKSFRAVLDQYIQNGTRQWSKYLESSNALLRCKSKHWLLVWINIYESNYDTKKQAIKQAFTISFSMHGWSREFLWLVEEICLVFFSSSPADFLQFLPPRRVCLWALFHFFWLLFIYSTESRRFSLLVQSVSDSRKWTRKIDLVSGRVGSGASTLWRVFNSRGTRLFGGAC